MSVGGYQQTAIGSLSPIFGGAAVGPGGAASSFVQEFTDADLVAGVLAVPHNLQSDLVAIVIRDNTFAQIVPDDIQFIDGNNASVDLSSFAPIAGTWKLLAVGP